MDCPVNYISWVKAAQYCNWLSREEELPEVFEIEGDVITLKPNYLSLTGYRLPTEAEMEYATRANSITSRHYGETDELLSKYARYQANAQQRTWPAGTLKPNEWGLFDPLGNLWAWCLDANQSYPSDSADRLVEDRESSTLNVTPSTRRVFRGGSFFVDSRQIRSAQRGSGVQSNTSSNLGFRIARTIQPAPQK